MKKSKIIVPALGMLLLSTAASVTGTVAWFSTNRVVTATGMKVHATTSDSLVISKGTPVGTDITVDLSGANTQLSPATHFDSSRPNSKWDATANANKGGYVTGGENTTNLQYIYNTSEISSYTGEKQESSEEDLIYLDAINGKIGETASSTTNYYYDYQVFIASSGTAMTDKTLCAEFDETTTSALKSIYNLRDTKNAFTIDFYVESLTTIATMNITNYSTKLAAVDANGEAPVVELKTGLSIPLNTDTGHLLRVTMRVYMDGALSIGSKDAYELSPSKTAQTGVDYYTKSDSVDSTTGMYKFTKVTEGITYPKAATETESAVEGSDVSAYYVKSASTNDYVYTNVVDTSEFEFGVKFSVK